MKRRRTKRKDPRRPPNWDSLSDLTLKVTFGRCCNCWIRAAKHSHHTMYPPRWLQWPLICLFPLCLICHGFAHRRENYYISRKSNWYNRNYFGFYLKLLTKTILLIAVEWSAIIGAIFCAGLLIYYLSKR
jgi:hypothetical protein